MYSTSIKASREFAKDLGSEAFYHCVSNLPLSRYAKDSPVTADMTKPSVVQTQNPPVRVIAFARTPNRDLGAGGLTAKYAALANKVKFVSLTHGDVGHQS